MGRDHGPEALRYDLPGSIQRLVVLGDPHGALHAVRRVILEERDPWTLVACVGDVVGYADGPASSRLAEFLSRQAIPTVQGNHEHWALQAGRLVIVTDSHAPSEVTPAALAWMRSLPEAIEFRRTPGDELLALMIHSIRHPSWDWIHESHVSALVERLGRPAILLCGHSHRPRFMFAGARGTVHVEPYDFVRHPEKSAPIPEDGTIVVDAGSLARPELDPVIGDERERPCPPGWGTYALVDLASRSVHLKRIGPGHTPPPDQG